jgi:hypothetical protein
LAGTLMAHEKPAMKEKCLSNEPENKVLANCPVFKSYRSHRVDYDIRKWGFICRHCAL